MSTPITSWESLPLILSCHHMAALLDVQVSTIWRRCAERRMTPKPHAYQRPYQWYREAVRAEFERGIVRAPIGRPARRRAGQRDPLLSEPAADVRLVNQSLTADLQRGA